MKKRLISLLLAFSMMLTFLPAGAVSAFAEEGIDSSKGTLIPNDYTGSVYTIAEENATYQMKGNYKFPIEITATGVTINITGEITYGFDSYHDASWGFSYLINVRPIGGVTSGVTINNNDNYNVTTDKSDCGFVATWGLRTAENPNAPAGSAIVNGGSYTTFNQEPLWNSQGEMTLINVTAECQNDLAVTNRMGTMTIDGGSYKSINSTAIYNNRGGVMTIKGKPEVVAQNGVALCSASGVVTVEDGSFSGGNGYYSDRYWDSAKSAVCNGKSSKMTIKGGTFTGTDRADAAIVNNGEMHIANATVDAKNGSALKNQYLDGGTCSASTEIISGTFKDSAKGINLQSGSVVLKDAEFSGNGADIYLNTDKQITIEETFKRNATVACADPQDGRQLTTTTDSDYQKKLNLTSKNEDYIVGYEKDESGEYRNLTARKGEDGVMRYTVTVVDGTATAEINGETVELDSTTLVPEGTEVTVKANAPQESMHFDQWAVSPADLLGDTSFDWTADTTTFKMPAHDLTFTAQYATDSDDGSDIIGPIIIGGTVIAGGAVLGYQAYSLGAEFAGKLLNLPYFPSNRSALAMMLWEDAGKPMPESELLYPDVGQEERDMDLQHAARWAMENELIPDLNDEGTAPEEMKFYPDNAVSKIDVLKAWQKAQELKQNA